MCHLQEKGAKLALTRIMEWEARWSAQLKRTNIFECLVGKTMPVKQHYQHQQHAYKCKMQAFQKKIVRKKGKKTKHI